MMKYKLEVPINIRLKLDSLKIEQAIGSKVASHVKKLLKSGTTPGGKSLNSPKDAGKENSTSKAPLKRTGQLIKSVRYSRSTGTVGPSGTRNDPGRSRGTHWRRNYAVYSILVASHLQPGLEVDEATAKLMSETAEASIAKQLAKPGKGLVGEIKRISRGYR